MRSSLILLPVLALLVALPAGTKFSSSSYESHGFHLASGSNGSSKPSSPINWGKPSWADTFNGTKLNTKRWSVYDDPTGKYSGWRRTPSSVRVHSGHLEIIGHYQRPYGYVGGGLSYRHNQTYERWSVRFRADSGAGWEPVVLLWPEGKWPSDGEIDMAEISNPDRRGAGEFLHLGRNNRFIGKAIPKSVNFTKWHILAVDWLPGHITYWLDGKRLWTVIRRKGSKNYVPNTPFHLAMQNDAGCADHKCKPNKSGPKRVVMQVDWVRIWDLP
jgi:beta-glucanase (GH16 family)